MSDLQKIRIGSLFSGIGGFELGFKKALGKKVRICWACEIDKYCREIYQKHFPDVKLYGDIREINPEELEDVDIITGGFPCQSFSVAGKRKGFKDRRGSLYFEILRIAKIKKPNYILLENVYGLFTQNKGHAFETILKTLAELGYCIEWQMLDSQYFGVPQHRERVFIIGYIGEGPGSKIFPALELKNNDKSRHADNEKNIYSWQGKSGLINVFFNITPTLMKQKSNAIYIYEEKKLSKYRMNIRKLTPVECERLQGFPDDWTEGVSETQRFMMLGNAVTVNVIEFIAKKLFKVK